MLKRIKYGLLLVATAFFAVNAQAQDTPTELFKQMQNARENGVSFVPYELFNIINGQRHNQLSKETMLQPRTTAISELYFKHPAAVAIKVTNADGAEYTLNMMRSNPFAANANISYIDNNGSHPLNNDEGIHYQGALAGYSRSLATLSVFENGQVMMLFANNEGNFVIGQLEDNSNNYILYNDRDFLISPSSTCTTADELTQDSEPVTTDKTTGAYVCQKLSLYWETDYELYQNKQSSTLLLQSYISSLFNNVQALYRNESIAVELKTLKVWTVADGYTDGKSSDALNDFRSKWNAQSDNFDGDLAMLLARDAGGLGGIAYRNILCKRTHSYAYGDIHGAVSTIPTYSWDVSMVSHELGHNIASRHTHWCGWNTGTGGTCGSIDDCVKQESGNGCSSCSSTYDNSQPISGVGSWQGTIMSYCHLEARKIDLANGFGPLPGGLMRSTISNSNCLEPTISAELITTEICKNEGTITIDYDSVSLTGTNHFGTNPYIYTWSTGQNTKVITVTKPGNYSVTITDSNGCTRSYNVEVKSSTSDTCNESTTSIKDIQPQYVSMYPNPAQDNVLLKFFSNTDADVVIRVNDVMGRVVNNVAINAAKGENNVTLDVSALNTGMYYVVLSSTDQQYISLKLVVQ